MIPPTYPLHPFNMNDANPSRITATAGTKLVRITKEVMSLSSFFLEFYDILPYHSSI